MTTAKKKPTKTTKQPTKKTTKAADKIGRIVDTTNSGDFVQVQIDRSVLVALVGIGLACREVLESHDLAKEEGK